MGSWARQGVLLWFTATASAAMGQPAAVAAVAPPTESKCGLLIDTPDGKGQFEERGDLRPLSQTGPGKTFAVDAPLEAAVMCGRSSILPMPYDIQVAITGRPFYIINQDSDRIGVLEINDGLCEYRMVKGALTADEEKLLEPRLQEMQTIAAGMAP